jgi:tight adherence protein B
MDFLISTCIFAVILVLSLVVLSTGRRGGDKTRVEEMLARVTADSEEAFAGELLRLDPRRRGGGKRSIFGALYALKPFARLEQMMWQAGIYLHVSEILLLTVVLAGVGYGAADLALGDAILAAGAGGAAAALPPHVNNRQHGRRLRAFSRQLPAALDLMKSSLEAGHTLLRGLQVLVREFSDPLRSEFRLMLEQTRLGMALPRAFEDLLRRVPEDDLRLLVVAIKVQSEVGSSLAQIIGRLSEIVRTRQQLQGQIHAMTSQGRMSGMIVGLLPIFVLAAFSLVQPGYTDILFHDPMGIKVVKAAIGLDAMAFFTIRRILNVEY